MRHFAFQKPDLDTVLTAWILGFRPEDKLILASNANNREMLSDQSIICIECGGSGQVDMGNFDHHDMRFKLPCACVQAYSWKGISDLVLYRLVKYVQAVDEGIRHCHLGRSVSDIHFSGIYSGMLLTHSNSLFSQFYRGIDLFQFAYQNRIDPWNPQSNIPEWENYIQAKKKQYRQLKRYASHAIVLKTISGIRFGYLKAPIPGIHALLRRLGCKISIAQGLNQYNNRYYTSISSHNLNMTVLLPALLKKERGWGGPDHGRIISSPKSGTTLSEKDIINMVRVYF